VLLNLFCALDMSGAREDRKDTELSRVIQVATRRLGELLAKPVHPEDVDGDSEQSHDRADEEDLDEAVEAALAGVRRPRHFTGRPRGTNQGQRRRLREFVSKTGLLENSNTVNIAQLVEHTASLLQGYAMFTDWIEAGSNLASEFGLPRIVTLPRSDTEGVLGVERVPEPETDEGGVKRTRPVKRNFRGRFR
jgi:hypothetical protein